MARILIVEDERIVALDLQRRLARYGYDVVGVASSGDEAVHKALSSSPDLILMDVQLQGVPDGIEASTRIRRERESVSHRKVPRHHTARTATVSALSITSARPNDRNVAAPGCSPLTYKRGLSWTSD